MIKKTQSQSFLLRCWAEQTVLPEAKPTWRFSIQEIGRKRRHVGFADLQSVFDFLKEIIEDTAADEEVS